MAVVACGFTCGVFWLLPTTVCQNGERRSTCRVTVASERETHSGKKHLGLALLILVKFAMYCAICRAAPRALGVKVENPKLFVFAWALTRLAIGLVSGVVIFFAFAGLQASGMTDWLAYLLTFGVARYFEWSLVLLLITRQLKTVEHPPGNRRQLWVLSGTAANIGIDLLAIAGGFGSLRFFC